jgi:hypothetical protein
MEIVMVNKELKIIYTDVAVLSGLSNDHFTTMIQEAKQRIARRKNILDRFEHWELMDSSPDPFEKLLLSRCKNETEIQIVKSYMAIYRSN